MSQVNFFTPIYFGSGADTSTKKAIETVDSYFHFCGKKAVIINSQKIDQSFEASLRDTECTSLQVLKTIAIVASFFTIVIPLIMLTIKSILRRSHQYKLIATNPQKNEKPVPVKPIDTIHAKTLPLDRNISIKETFNELQVQPEIETSLIQTPSAVSDKKDLSTALIIEETITLKDISPNPLIKLETKKVSIPINDIEIFSAETTPQEEIIPELAAEEEIFTPSESFVLPNYEPRPKFEIKQSTLDKIQNLLPEILKLKNIEEINWLSKNEFLVFRLKDDPNKVFKVHYRQKNDDVNKRYQNMQKAEEVCSVHNLGLLVIPAANKFSLEANGKKYEIIAEESLDFNSEESIQEGFYYKYSKQLSETIRQLAQFIFATGFNDVTYRNIPLLNESESFYGYRRIGLIDLEHLNSAYEGFNGSMNGSQGLLRCVSEEQMNIVLEEAKTNNISIKEETINKKLESLAQNKKLEEFYRKKGITGKEPLQVDIHSLGLNLNEKDKHWITDPSKFVTLEQAVKEFIALINEKIQQKSDAEILKNKRSIYISDNEKICQTCIHAPHDDYADFIAMSTGVYGKKTTPAPEKWNSKILNALIEKGYIFSTKNSRLGFIIQA